MIYIKKIIKQISDIIFTGPIARTTVQGGRGSSKPGWGKLCTTSIWEGLDGDGGSNDDEDGEVYCDDDEDEAK